MKEWMADWSSAHGFSNSEPILSCGCFHVSSQSSVPLVDDQRDPAQWTSNTDQAPSLSPDFSISRVYLVYIGPFKNSGPASNSGIELA